MKGQAFYETAAQIIPVLLLVLAVQTRSFATSRPVSIWLGKRQDESGVTLPRVLDAFVLMALYGVVVAAEMVALATLYTGTDAAWRRWFVTYVVLELFVFIGFIATGLIPTRSEDG